MTKILIAIFTLLVLFSVVFYFNIPDVKNLKSDCIHVNMNDFQVCKSSASYIDINNISEELIDAILVSEDVSFYGHSGFEWYEIKESFIKNILKGRFARGGSTITQQLVKNLYLTGRKSVFRKLMEAYVTMQIEKQLSKDQILELYLNVVEFGPDIYGVQAASEYYFNTNPGSVSALQGAYLAYLLPSPKKYHTHFEKGELTEYAEKRIRDILLKMYKYEKIQKYQYDQYLDEISMFPYNSF